MNVSIPQLHSLCVLLQNISAMPGELLSILAVSKTDSLHLLPTASAPVFEGEPVFELSLGMYSWVAVYLLSVN